MPDSFPMAGLWGPAMAIDTSPAIAQLSEENLLVAVVCAVIALLILFRLTTKDWIRAGLLVAMVLVLFLSYGSVYGVVRTWSLAGLRVGRHIFLLPLWGLILSSWAWIVMAKVRVARRTAPGSTLPFWLTAVLLVSIAVRGAVLAVSTIPSYESRRQHIASLTVEYGKLEFCNHYFPFCGPGNDTTASVGPVPILVFAALMSFFEQQFLYPAVILQLLLSLSTAFVIYRLSLRLFDNPSSALLGAFLWGTYLPIINPLGLALESETIFTFFLSLGVLMLLRGLSGDRPLDWFIAGACFGLVTLSRSSFLLFPLILFPLVLLIPFERFQRRLVNYGILLIVFTAFQTPWTLRNYRVFEAFVPGNTLGGYNLYRHNHILEDRNYFRYVYHPEMIAATALLVEGRDDLRGDENELEMDRVYRQEAIEIIKAHPLRYLALSLYRFIPLYTNYGVDDESLSPMAWSAIGLENILLLALAAAAVVRRRVWPRTLVVPAAVMAARMTAAVSLVPAALIVYFTLGHMLVVARMRFIVPVMPFVIAFAADQCVYWAMRLRARLQLPFSTQQPPFRF